MLDQRLVIVSGKGGSGKSAFAAGLALLAQKKGLRVLAVEMSNTMGLAAHLGTAELGFEPLEARPGLHAMQMVRSKALLEYLSIQLGVKTFARFGPMARAFDALATAAPGIREIITIGKLIWEVKEDRWDIVIADAPPTGQIGSYLRAPETIRDLVSAGRVRAQAETMQGVLIDQEQTRLVLMTLAEELPTTETTETMAWLEAEQPDIATTIVANRILDPLSSKATPPGPVGGAATLHRAIYSEQQQWLNRLPPDFSLPYLFGLFTPTEVAAQLSDTLESVL